MNTAIKEVLKLALDLAIMHHSDDGYAELRSKVRQLAKEALAQPEQPSFNEWTNAKLASHYFDLLKVVERYEKHGVTCQTFRHFVTEPCAECNCVAPVTAIKEALAQDEQEPCGGCGGSGWVPRDPDIGTDQECFDCNGSGAQPEQEPVAWIIEYEVRAGGTNRGSSLKKFDYVWHKCSFVSEDKDAELDAITWRNRKETPLYTAPPAQRPWVGLTDEPTYTEQQIANACWAAEISDSKCESLLIALQEAAPNIGVKP